MWEVVAVYTLADLNCEHRSEFRAGGPGGQEPSVLFPTFQYYRNIFLKEGVKLVELCGKCQPFSGETPFKFLNPPLLYFTFWKDVDNSPEVISKFAVHADSRKNPHGKHELL